MNHKRNYFVMLLFVVIMFFCLFFVCFKILFDKDSVKELVINFDLIRLLRDDEKINDILSDKKIPDAIFDYIDTDEIRKKAELFIDNFYNDESTLIDRSDIVSLMKKSINVYENKYTVDVYSIIEDDIIKYSNEVTKNLNNNNWIVAFNSIYNLSISNYVYILYFLLILIIFFLFYLEKKFSIGFIGFVCLVFSILIFCCTKYFIVYLLDIFKIPDYINDNIQLYITDKVSFIYCFLFVVGIFLLFSYLIIFINKLIAKSRILYYDKYYKW